MRELTARVRAVLRRIGKNVPQADVLRAANITLDRDYRLIGSYGSGDLGETPGVSETLDVEKNALHFRIISQVVDQVSKVHIQHGADAYKMAECCKKSRG